GKQAKTDLKDCNKCHEGMSTHDLEGYEEVSTLNKLLSKNSQIQTPKKNHYNYAKDNTFCQECHSQRPPSHTSYFMKEHGTEALIDREMCMACHELQKSNNTNNSQVACATCHPSSHYKNTSWRKGHPIEVKPGQKLTQSC
ncbi:cytochrome c3 family protein, partial [Lysinibacillus fusiformis]